MDIITDSVNRMEETLRHSGCDETGVRLDVDPDTKNCQFERGACMTASFGGRTAEFVTDEPIRALTKISFMFGTPLETSNVRSAACAIMNVVTAFFCLNRVRRACPGESHATCLGELAAELQGHRVFCGSTMPALERALGSVITPDFDEADTIVINNESVIDREIGDLIVRTREKKRVIFVGPSTAGVCRLQQREHWCPYGK
ncbi:MAG: hypothetical protein WC342_00930 [Methanoregula sp.]